MAADGSILIAGGGIGGLALALALARTGRSSVVVERALEFEPIGAGIQIGPNGVRVLARLGLAEALHPLVGTPEALEARAGASGRLLARLPLGAWIAARHGAPYWVAHRGDLHGVLLQAALSDPRITVHTGFELASFTAGAAEVRATNQTDVTIAAPALVGADGLWSRVREILHPNLAPQFAGATATRTVITAEEAGPLATSSVGLWLTRDVHVVHYPVRGGSEIALVIIAREEWLGRAWDQTTDARRLLARLSGFHASLREVLAPVEEWRKWALHTLPPLPHWSSGRVTLMGDAAHPMLPYLAQGGVLALEDALVLAECLAAEADEARAFRRFESQRRKRATRVQAVSRRQGRIYHLPPPLSWGRDAVLRLTPGAWLMAGFDWMYGWPPR